MSLRLFGQRNRGRDQHGHIGHGHDEVAARSFNHDRGDQRMRHVAVQIGDEIVEMPDALAVDIGHGLAQEFTEVGHDVRLLAWKTPRGSSGASIVARICAPACIVALLIRRCQWNDSITMFGLS